ncbi:hypothetical protein ABFK62_15655 [Acinetobacter baumannii]
MATVNDELHDRRLQCRGVGTRCADQRCKRLYITAAIPVTGEGPVAIHAEAVDAQGNVDVADADVTVTVDTVPADLIGAITIPEDLNGDGIFE